MSFRYDVSAVIVSYNCLDSLKACLESLLAQERVRAEIIAVDNNSTDGSASFLSGQNIKSILLKANLGYGVAVNRAVEQAEGRFLCILNPDTVLTPSSLHRMMTYAHDHPAVGLVAPALRHPDGRPQLSARRLPGRRDILIGRGSPLRLFGLAGDEKAGYIVCRGHDPVEVPAVSATAVLIETTFFRKLGGFDERYFMYMEDLDLCLRIGKENRKIVLLPDVLVTHAWRRSSRQRPYFSSYHHHRSIYRYFVKHRPGQLPYNLLLLLALIIGFSINSVLIFLRIRGAR